MVPSPRRLPRTISPLEGEGFEPSVPRQRDNAFRDSPVQLDPSRAVVPWDAIHASLAQARDYQVFLAFRGDFLELWCPPVLRRLDIFFRGDGGGRVALGGRTLQAEF
jgi:hypothetical protein